MNTQLPKPKYQSGQKVAYFGNDLTLVGKVFTIESEARYLPNNEPSGYYYDLTHHGLKRVHESELTTVTDEMATSLGFIEHDRTKDSQGRSRIFPKGEFIEGGFPE